MAIRVWPLPSLLVLLKDLAHAGILMGSLYFLLTVVQLGLSLYRIQQPQQRRQAISILIAALISTLPIGYTLYLAFLRRTEFALGRGQWPMFFASMLFMAAYAHGMLRHRLMLTDDSSEKGHRYALMSLLVSGGVLVAIVGSGVGVGLEEGTAVAFSSKTGPLPAGLGWLPNPQPALSIAIVSARRLGQSSFLTLSLRHHLW